MRDATTPPPPQDLFVNEGAEFTRLDEEEMQAQANLDTMSAEELADLAASMMGDIDNASLLARTLRKKGRKAVAKAKPTGPPKKRGRPRKEPRADDDEGPKKSIKGKKLKKKKKKKQI
eukprot:gene23606-9136_t